MLNQSLQWPISKRNNITIHIYIGSLQEEIKIDLLYMLSSFYTFRKGRDVRIGDFVIGPIYLCFFIYRNACKTQNPTLTNLQNTLF